MTAAIAYNLYQIWQCDFLNADKERAYQRAKKALNKSQKDELLDYIDFGMGR